MATLPENPVIKIAHNDVVLPSTGKANKEKPNIVVQTTGYDDGQFVSSENLNYILDNFSSWITYLKEVVEQREMPVGSVIEISGDPTNPAVLFGYGTWESFAAGMTTVGVGSHTDDRGESKAWIDGQTEGEYRHVQTTSEVAEHNHTGNTDNDVDSVTVRVSDIGTDTGTAQNVTSVTGTTKDLTHNHTFTTDNQGSSSPMNNIQPSVAVYKWKRIS